MIVQPTPTNPRSPIRRALRLGGLALPLVLLAVVTGAGVLGTPRPSPAPGPEDPATDAATLLPSASPSMVPDTGPGTAIEAQSPGLPTQIGDVRVWPVARVAEAAMGVHEATAVALSGFLWITGPDAACSVRDGEPFGPWCDRGATLVDWSFANASTFVAGPPPRVPVVIPVGVRVPEAVTNAILQPGDDGPHVIVVGRFTSDVAACRHVAACVPGFVVDRFAWVDGNRIGLTPLVADGLATGTRRANPLATALDAAVMPLMGVLVWPEDLSAIDADASAAAATSPPAKPVWYLRVLDGDRASDMERRVRWLLLDERRLELLASGRPGWYAIPPWVAG